MTILPVDGVSTALQGGQITYRQATEIPGQKAIHPGQISSPLGGREGGESYQKPKRIPAARRLVLRDDYSFRNSKSKDRVSNSDRINAFAIKTALDYLNRSYHYENKKMRSVDDVTSHLFSILADKLKAVSDYDAATRGGKSVMTFPMVERYAERAAVYAVDTWRPDYFDMQARKGAKGGRKSKRKPKYTYRDFLAVDGLTHAEAAAVLNMSVMTVRRMRDRFKKPEPVSGDFLPATTRPATGAQPSVDDLISGL